MPNTPTNIETAKPVLLSVNEFCRRLNIKQNTFYKYKRMQKIKSRKIFGKRLIEEGEIARILRDGTE